MSELTTYTLKDRGYDCDQDGTLYECTAGSLIEAIRMLDQKFAKASFAQTINDVRGCSTFAVYKRLPGSMPAAYTKIGCVYLARSKNA